MVAFWEKSTNIKTCVFSLLFQRNWIKIENRRSFVQKSTEWIFSEVCHTLQIYHWTKNHNFPENVLFSNEARPRKYIFHFVILVFFSFLYMFSVGRSIFVKIGDLKNAQNSTLEASSSLTFFARIFFFIFSSTFHRWGLSEILTEF